MSTFSRPAAGRDLLADVDGDAPMSLLRGPGLFRVDTGDGLPLVTNIRRLAGRDDDIGIR